MLYFSRRLTAGTLSSRRRHQTATVLAGNHNHFFNNHFPRRLNPPLLQRLVNLQKINNQKHHGQTKNKEQRNKNNQRRIRHGSFPPFLIQQQQHYSLYEPQLSKNTHSVGAPQILSPPQHANYLSNSSFFPRRNHLSGRAGSRTSSQKRTCAKQNAQQPADSVHPRASPTHRWHMHDSTVHT